MANTSNLPSVELWWPHLEIPSKHWLAAHMEEHVPAWIITEISTLSQIGELPADVEFLLSEDDRRYIRTQTELVD